MNHADWQAKYRKMKVLCDRIHALQHARMVKVCREAGLDSSLLGIHPHNAWCAYQAGKPWPDVDYDKVRLLRYLERRSYIPNRILANWDARVRNMPIPYPHPKEV